MRLTRNTLGSVIGLVAALALALPGGSPAAAAPAAPEAGTASEARAASEPPAAAAVEATDAAGGVAAGATRAVTTTWTLVDFGPGQEQRICTPPNFARPNLYFFVILDGTWSTPIHYGLSDLPAGSQALTGGLVGPGSGDGHRVNAFAAFHLAATPVGRYTSTLWASDGVVTQTATVIIDVKENCY